MVALRQLGCQGFDAIQAARRQHHMGAVFRQRCGGGPPMPELAPVTMAIWLMMGGMGDS